MAADAYGYKVCHVCSPICPEKQRQFVVCPNSVSNALLDMLLLGMQPSSANTAEVLTAVSNSVCNTRSFSERVSNMVTHVLKSLPLIISRFLVRECELLYHELYAETDRFRGSISLHRSFYCSQDAAFV